MPRPPSSRSRIPSRIRCRNARGSSRSKPSRASVDRRLDEVRPLARREALVDLLEPGEEAGHRDRAVADVEHLRPGVAEVDDELLHLAEPALGHPEEAVEHRRLAARLVDEREAAAGRARERPFGDERRERGCEERVDRVAAVAQDARAGLGGQRMAGCDRASHRGRVNRCALRRRGDALVDPGEVSLPLGRVQERRQLGIDRRGSCPSHVELGPPGAAAHPAEPRRDDRDPDLAGQPRVDGRAEDDVRLVRRGLAHDLGGLVDLDEREVVAARDREQDARARGRSPRR